MNTQFFETRMGDRFFNGSIPRLIEVLDTIGKELKKLNDLKKENEMIKFYNGVPRYFIEGKEVNLGYIKTGDIFTTNGSKYKATSDAYLSLDNPEGSHEIECELVK